MMDEKSITEDGFMDNLKTRFTQKQIYTYIGEQLVSMNPFQKVDIYDQKTMASYKNKYMYCSSIFSLIAKVICNLSLHHKQ